MIILCLYKQDNTRCKFFNRIVFNYVLFLRSVIKNKNLRKIRRFIFYSDLNCSKVLISFSKNILISLIW